MAEKDASKVLSTVSDQFTNIAQDLFNIEVNIILRDNITAQKMPNPRHALLDIGKEYCAALEEMEIWRQAYYQKPETAEDDMFTVMRRELGYVTVDELTERADRDSIVPDRIVSHRVGDELGGFDAFDVLRNWADSFMDDLRKEIFLSPAQLAVLPRIKDNADLLKGMFSSICRRDPVLNEPILSDEKNLAKQLDQMPEDKKNPNTIVKLSKRLNHDRTVALTNEYTRSDLVNSDKIQPLPLRDSELVMVRKVWELGTEVIAMQTIVQVDGDVITRLNPDYLNESRYPKLHDYHTKGVNMALKHWTNLVNVAKELLVATAKGISERLSA